MLEHEPARRDQATDEAGERRRQERPAQRSEDRQPLRVRVAREPDRRRDHHEPERGQDHHVEAAGAEPIDHAPRTRPRSPRDKKTDPKKVVTRRVVRRCRGVEADERAWIDGLRQGDAAAFDAVFGAYRRRLFGYLVRMTRRKDAAEDLLQEVFLRLAQHARRLDEDTRLGAWLFTVAHRMFVSWTRARAVRAQLAGDLPTREVAGTERSPLEALADSHTQLALERAFAALAPAYREVALLVGVEGLQPAEVAEILGQKPEAVRQRLARARAQLAEALGEHAPAAWRTP